MAAQQPQPGDGVGLTVAGAQPGRLVVVATPIGNLGDLSPRAADALRTADLVLAEDTRRTGRLLAHAGSDVRMTSLHEHNERDRVADIVARLAEGAVIALVSDAGTPGVSDPGYVLVRACVDAGIRVEPVPGPSALLAALVASGLPTDRFTFEGFLPRKGQARRDRLAELAVEPRTIVLYVSPHRGAADLADLGAALGPSRRAALARELTKLHEEVVHGTLEQLAARADDGLRGEVALVIEGAHPQDKEPADLPTLVEIVRRRAAAGERTKDVVKDVASAAGIASRDLYQAVVDAG